MLRLWAEPVFAGLQAQQISKAKPRLLKWAEVLLCLGFQESQDFFHTSAFIRITFFFSSILLFTQHTSQTTYLTSDLFLFQSLAVFHEESLNMNDYVTIMRLL